MMLCVLMAKCVYLYVLKIVQNCCIFLERDINQIIYLLDILQVYI